MRPIFIAATACLLASACTSEKAPSEQIGEAAEQLVEDAADAISDEQPKGPLAPRNECSQQPGADAFLKALSDVVAKRDAVALTKLVSPKIKLDFGGGAGTDELRERLALPQRSLWDELDDLMRLGCSANEEGVLTLPWYFAQDLGDTDPYAAMIVTGNDVALHDEPAEVADTIDKVSWDVVELVDGLEPGRGFEHVRTRGGKTGYIASGSLRSVIDYRLIANRVTGKWQVTALVAGD